MLLDGLVRIFNGVGLSKQRHWDEILVGVDGFGVDGFLMCLNTEH